MKNKLIALLLSLSLVSSWLCADDTSEVDAQKTLGDKSKASEQTSKCSLCKHSDSKEDKSPNNKEEETKEKGA